MDHLCSQLSSVSIDNYDRESRLINYKQHIDCSFQNLYHINTLVGRLISLKCPGNHLTSLPNIIGTIETLTFIDCSENAITILPLSIGNLINLSQFICNRNNLEHLSTLHNCRSLTLLDCSENRIHHLDPSMTSLPLKCLNVAYNTTFDHCLQLSNLSNLHKLDTLHCSLSDSYVPFDTIPRLQRLVCRGKHLALEKLDSTPLVDSLNLCHNLREFTMSKYHINPLETERLRMTRLDHLCLTDMMIETIPGIGNLVGLLVLNLSNNLIKRVPETLYRLQCLKELYLNNNKLTTISPEIQFLQSLNILQLKHNQIETMPPESLGLHGLVCLQLCGNPIQYLPPNHERITHTLDILYDDAYETVADELLEHPYKIMKIEFWTTLYTILRTRLSMTPQMTINLIHEINSVARISNEAKESLIRMIDGPIDPVTRLRFLEILPYVWLRIVNHEQAELLFDRFSLQIPFVVDSPVIIQISHLISTLFNTCESMLWCC